jgi:hypothetical protein
MNDQNQNDTELGETGTDRFDAGVAKVARETYQTPPETPRDDMWAVIQASRAADVVPIRRFRPQLWWAAVAAALVIGVVLGRGSLEGPDGTTTVADGGVTAPAVDGATPAGAPGGVANAVPRSYRTAAARHLNRTETFLTMFRVDVRSDQVEGMDLGPWAKRLLTDTRLLLDSPAGGDPELRMLLSDLELVLAQIVQLRTDDPYEVEIIDEGLESSQLLFRLRAAQATAPATVRL